MYPWQVKLYADLTILCSTEDRTFFYVDHVLEGRTYRVFAYHYATYTDWQKPNALECRGVMFELVNGSPVRLACLPMEKFFNVNENPFTQYLDFSAVKEFAEKRDGSLISTFMHGPFLKLKSKTSLTSEQAQSAMKWLVEPSQTELFRDLQALTSHGFTVNMEWTSPDNRIVVPYFERRLTILNVRHNAGGDYQNKYVIQRRYPALAQYWCPEHKIHQDFANLTDPYQYVKNLKDFEGFVLYFHGGLKAKLKTDWYVTLHRSKDTIASEKKLYLAIVAGGYDNLMSFWCEDAQITQRITAMQKFVAGVMSSLTKVHDYYNENKHLDRKSYAIKGKQEIPDLFHMAMNLYSGKEANFVEHMEKNIERYLPQAQLGNASILPSED